MNMTKIRFRMTASELAAGRYLRAPDHDASTGGGEAASSSESQPAGNADDAQELTTEQKLEKEFPDPSATGGEEVSADDDAGASDDDGDDGDEGEDGDDGDKNTGDDVEFEAKDPETRKRAQERMDKLTNDARYHEREAAKWRAEAERLGAAPEGAEIELPDEPDVDKYAYGEHDPEYIRDRAKYDAKMEILEGQASAKFKAEAAALEQKWTQNQAKAVERYPDFEEKVVQNADKWPCPVVVALGIKDSEVGPDIAYELASAPEEAQRIANMTPLEQAREFGRMEQRHIDRLARGVTKAEGGKSDAKPAPKIVSQAPPPPKKRPGGSNAATQGGIKADAEDFAVFERSVDNHFKKRA